ncbi:class I tRNA ligase family protein [Cupriavidus basilensis]
MDVDPVEQDGKTVPTLRETGAGRHRSDRVLSVVRGRQRLQQHDRQPPDRTLSRQRQRGVPGWPSSCTAKTGALHPRTPELLEEVAKRVEQAPASRPGRRWTRPNCSATRPASTRWNRDTLDVRFDSGTTHWTVIRRLAPRRPGRTRRPMKPTAAWRICTSEGSDQHRGWFHSSLLTASMLYGKPPTRRC